MSDSNANGAELHDLADNEDVVDDLVEDEIPASGAYEVQTQVPTYDQKTRSHLAKIIIWALVGSYAVGILAFIFDFIDAEKYTALIASVSGLQALAAAAVGFYYGSNNESK